jgi:cell division protein FtsI (penicillin-binding protein 3)
VVASRPDIVDRNGELLATDLNMVSLYAEPRRIVDADEVIEKLALVLPGIDWSEPPRLGRRPQLVRSRVYDKQDDEQIFS